MEGIDVKEISCGVKVFLFISREDGSPHAEFHKYRFAEAKSEKPDSSKGFDWRYSHRQKTLRVFVHKRAKDWLGEEAWGLIGMHDGNRPSKLAQQIDATPNELKFASDAIKIFGSEGAIANGVKKFLRETICKLDLPEVKQLKEADFKVPCTIFMHWGGGDEPDYAVRETAIRKILPRIAGDDISRNSDNGWKFFSIGTQRNDLFNVDGDGNLIIIPEKRKDLEELEQRFERNNLIEKSNAALAKVAGGVEIEGEDIGNLKNRLKDERNRILHSNLKHGEKDKLLRAIAISVKYLEEAKAMPDDQKVKTTSTKRKTANQKGKNGTAKIKVPTEFVGLAAKILNKEVFHG